MDAKAIILCVVFLLHSCFNVDIDYYADDNTASHIETEDYVQDARRLGDGSLAPLAEDHSCNVEETSTVVKLKSKTESIEDPFRTTSEELIEEIRDDIDSYEDTTIKLPLSHIFDDYEYNYEDDLPIELGDAEYTAQEYKDMLSQETNYTHDTTQKGLIKKNPSGKKADLFHIEPAVKKIKFRKNPTKIKKLFGSDEDDENVWYVPEEYPCWQLPILFGTFQVRAKAADIFVLKGGTLGDISLYPEEKVGYTPQARNADDSGNKWCDQGPCYGDHTLCTFPNDSISKICDAAYKVKSLSVFEQGVVLNTINSMRNRVAMGMADVYSHLPTASNMQQVMYDMDLAKISNRWLRQCLPGPAACSSLNNKLVTQLECKKLLNFCCTRTSNSTCTPREECFVPPLIGCLHAWFLSAGKNLENRAIECGHITRKTFHTAQMLWASTDKIGCAYGERSNGDIRVICNFSPGATFYLRTKYYCGIVPHKDVTQHFELLNETDITSIDFMASLGVVMNKTNLSTPEHWRKSDAHRSVMKVNTPWGVCFLRDTINGLLRDYQDVYVNGTVGGIAKLVTRYTFDEESNAKCDSDAEDQAIYKIGPPGSNCEETGRVFRALCYSYRDPYPGYRLAAIVAPVALFSLILYDLFSGVLRQTNF